MTQQPFVIANAPIAQIPALEATLHDALKVFDGDHVTTISRGAILRLARATDALTISLNTTAGPNGPHVRTGVDTGTAVRGPEGWGGPVVELAARLAEHARPGEVLVTSTTRQCTDRAEIDFVDLGEHHFQDDGHGTAVFRATRIVDSA